MTHLDLSRNELDENKNKMIKALEQKRDFNEKIRDKYAFNSQNIKGLHDTYYKSLILALVISSVTRVSLLSADSTGIAGLNGQDFDHLMNGVSNMLIIFFSYHVWLGFISKSFDYVYTLLFALSFSLIWFAALLDDYNEKSLYYASMYSEIFKSPVFWL